MDAKPTLLSAIPAIAGSRTSVRTITRVFHNQPADGDLPALAVNQLSFLQRAQQHYGTGGGEAQAKDDAGHQRPAEGGGERHTQQRRHGYLGDSPGMAIDFTAIRSLSEKCSPTPNISRMTPSSASSGASLVSATKPGERSGQHAR